MDTKEYERGMQGGESADGDPVTENIYGQDVKTEQAADITDTSEKQGVEREDRGEAPRDPVTAGEPFPTPVDDGFESSAEDYEPVTKPKSKSTSTKKVVIIVVIAVAVMGLLAAAFAAFVLPRITGESNPVADLISGTKKPDNTPGDVVAAFDKAFNENDRDAMANCFLPGQSLKRNTEGGVIQIINGIRGYFGSDNITAQGRLVYFVSCAVNQEAPDKAIVEETDLKEVYDLSAAQMLSASVAFALEKAIPLPYVLDQVKKNAIRRLTLPARPTVYTLPRPAPKPPARSRMP